MSSGGVKIGGATENRFVSDRDSAKIEIGPWGQHLFLSREKKIAISLGQKA
jgi:hypothetical protein